MFFIFLHFLHFFSIFLHLFFIFSFFLHFSSFFYIFHFPIFSSFFHFFHFSIFPFFHVFCCCSETECSSPVGEELVQQQLRLGTEVVLGSAVAAVSIVHTGLTGTSLLGDAEPTIRVPMEVSLSRDACLQDIRQVVTDKHERSGKCNWLHTRNVFQVSKHDFWSHCSKEE